MADGGDGGERPNNHGRYILVNREPVPEPDLFAWGEWLARDGNRVVQRSWMGSWCLSTIFLGLDHRFWGDGPPILFETMIFKVDRRSHKTYWYDYQRRYTTWNDAMATHRTLLPIVQRVSAHKLRASVLNGLQEVTT